MRPSSYCHWGSIAFRPAKSRQILILIPQSWKVAAWDVQVRSIDKTKLYFSSENKHIITISKCTYSILRYSLKKRVFWVQSELCSSFRSKFIEVKLRHFKTKKGMLSKLHEIIMIQEWLKRFFHQTFETNSWHGLITGSKTRLFRESRGL